MYQFRRLLFCVLTVVFLISFAHAETSYGFVYQLNPDGQTITITGRTGTLSAGQNLTIPSAIDGKTVTGITGRIGNVWTPLGSTDKYGTLTLPDTVSTISNFTCHGFTGTFIIPSSVTTLSGTNGGSDIEALIVNANVTGIGEEALRLFTGVRTVSMAEGITYVGGYNFCEAYNLERFNVPDSMKSLGSTNCFRDTAPIVFYLKRFEVALPYGFNGETTFERAGAIGIHGFKYVYTNQNETVPVEQMIIQTEGFSTFTDQVGQYYTSTAGLYKGWSGTISVTPLPLNASISSPVIITSDNLSVVRVEGNSLVASSVGTATITVRLDNIPRAFPVKVRGIYIINVADGIIANGMEGSIDLDNVNLDNNPALVLTATKIEYTDLNNIGYFDSILNSYFGSDAKYSEVFNIGIVLMQDDYQAYVQPKAGKEVTLNIPVSEVSFDV